MPPRATPPARKKKGAIPFAVQEPTPARRNSFALDFTLSDTDDEDAMMADGAGQGRQGTAPAAAPAKIPSAPVADDDDSDLDDIDLALKSPFQSSSNPSAAKKRKAGGVPDIKELLKQKNEREKAEAKARKKQAFNKAAALAAGEDEESSDDEGGPGEHAGRAAALGDECRGILGAASEEDLGPSATAQVLWGRPQGKQEGGGEGDSLLKEARLAAAGAEDLGEGTGGSQVLPLAEMLRGGWLRERCARAGSCPAPTARLLFYAAAYSADSREAEAAAGTLVELLAAPGHTFGRPVALTVGRRTTAPLSDAGWVPSADDLIKAFEAAGYDASRKQPQPAAPSPPPAVPPPLWRVSLLLQVVAAVARFSGQRGEVMSPGSAAALAEVLLRLTLDPAAGPLAAGLASAATAVLGCLPEAGWGVACPMIVAVVAGLGPCHAAPVKALMWLQQLPLAPERAAALLEGGACAAVRTAAAPGKGKGRGKGKGEAAGAGGMLEEVLGVLEPRFLEGAKAASQPPGAGGAAAEAVDWWELLSMLQLADILAARAAVEGAAEDKGSEALLERFSGSLRQLKMKLKRTTPAASALKHRAGELYSRYDFLARKRRAGCITIDD